MEHGCECDLKGRNVIFFQCNKAGFQLYKIILAVSIAGKTGDLRLSIYATAVGSLCRQMPLKTRLPLTTFPASNPENPEYGKCCNQPWVIPKIGRGPQSILKMIGENTWPSRPHSLYPDSSSATLCGEIFNGRGASAFPGSACEGTPRRPGAPTRQAKVKKKRSCSRLRSGTGSLRFYRI